MSLAMQIEGPIQRYQEQIRQVEERNLDAAFPDTSIDIDIDCHIWLMQRQMWTGWIWNAAEPHAKDESDIDIRVLTRPPG
eukprot:12409418-Karenia_brevis.AAC.1